MLDGAGRGEVYFGCASYDRSGSRTKTAIVALKVFRLDIDCGDGKKYATQGEAKQALKAFCSALKLDLPMIVNSGNGLHCYFIMIEDMTLTEWEPTADLLKAATQKFGLHADHHVTTDAARVLRPIGTYNRKDPANPKEVKLDRDADPISHAEFHMRLQDYLGTPSGGGIAGVMPAALAGLDDTSLSGPVRVDLPSDANIIANKCAAIGEMRDKLGDIDQPHWYHSLQVLCRTVQGDEVCHEWSKGHPNYSAAETQKKIEQVRNFRATTCEKFNDVCDACKGCPIRGTIVSPITLGENRTPQATAPAPAPTTPQPTNAPAPAPIVYPYPYGWGPIIGSNGRSVLWNTKRVEQPKDDGTTGYVDEKYEILDHNLYADARVITNGTYSMNVVSMPNKGEPENIQIECSLLNDGGPELFKQLGAKEVLLQRNQKTELHRYLVAWARQLRETHDKMPGVMQFGWHGDGFAIGHDYLKPNERLNAALRAPATSLADHLTTKGDLVTWVDAVDQAYNKPGDEAFQFCVMSAFSSPLWSMFGEGSGIVSYAYSQDSGKGKTTAYKVALSAWGFYDKLMRVHKVTTENALYQFIGAMQNLPVVLDEFTNATDEEASRIAYTVSSGAGKLRMTSDAQMRETLGWSTIVSLTGNRPITEMLARHRANAEAEQLRVWEFTIDSQSSVDPNDALGVFPTFTDHYGHAGRAYAEYLVSNRDAVKAQLMANRVKLNTALKLSGKERYWSMLIACTVTALEICRKLNLLRFDVKEMLKWLKGQLANNRGQVTANTQDPLTQFQQMLTDMSGHILNTQEVIGGQSLAHIVSTPRAPIAGRYISNISGTRETLYVSREAIRLWCGKHGTSYTDMYRELLNHKLIKKQGTKDSRKTLGSGTGISTGAVPCWDVNMATMRAMYPDLAVGHTGGAKVLTVHTGGKQAATP
jgi:hypothetical protein